jgi:predicted GIY-YIG superfamily endonuclease
MYYVYILLSPQYHKFYYGSSNDLKARLVLHNAGKVTSTKPYIPWKIVWYSAFETEHEARRFEQYLKTGSGKAFAYKRLITGALAKDFSSGRMGSPKSLRRRT